ncbi:MAG TPA: hypothetical protein VG125_04810, partial [Pirellulales bacterium]|nr:hypothetical protein [Pirellulales bacterium]
MTPQRLIIQALLLAALVTSAGCDRLSTRLSGARFVREVEWAGRGVWLKADTHTHTQFSDGTRSVSEVVEQ